MITTYQILNGFAKITVELKLKTQCGQNFYKVAFYYYIFYEFKRYYIIWWENVIETVFNNVWHSLEIQFERDHRTIIAFELL